MAATSVRNDLTDSSVRLTKVDTRYDSMSVVTIFIFHITKTQSIELGVFRTTCCMYREKHRPSD